MPNKKSMNWTPRVDGRTFGSSEPLVIVNVPSSEALLGDIDRHLAERTGFTVATLNLDHVVKLQDNEAFRLAYAAHSHVVADGRPIVWLGRISGQSLHLAPGSELVAPVMELAVRNDASVALVGSTPETLSRAAEALVHRHSNLRIVAKIAPPMGFDPESAAADEIIDKIATSGADLCFVAMGAPRQEIFAVRAHRRLPHVGFLSVGAGLDFLAGRQRRAPRLVRALAAEWLWRLLSDPRRLAGRYAACIAILPLLVGQALRARKERA